MRLTRKLVVAVLAVFAVLALAGVASAQADEEVTLCKKFEQLCANDNWWLTKPIPAVAQNVVFLSSLVNVKCAESEMIGETFTSMSTDLLFEITKLAFGSPTGKCEGCEKVITQGVPLDGFFTVTEPDTYNLETKISFKVEGCPFGLKCTYGTTNAVLEAENTEEGRPLLLASKVKLTRETGGGLCPETASWDASYKITVSNFLKFWFSLYELG